MKCPKCGYDMIIKDGIWICEECGYTQKNDKDNETNKIYSIYRKLKDLK
jgi:ribosomal protein L37AE/L43A